MLVKRENLRAKIPIYSLRKSRKRLRYTLEKTQAGLLSTIQEERATGLITALKRLLFFGIIAQLTDMKE